jgi:hypothetical protein
MCTITSGTPRKDGCRQQVPPESGAVM